MYSSGGAGSSVEQRRGGSRLWFELVAQGQGALPCLASCRHRLAESHDPGEVLPGAGVDLHRVAGLDEQRHLDDEAGLERRGLRAPETRSPCMPGSVSVDGELDRGGQVDAEDLAV